MTDFQLRIIDIITTPDEEYIRETEQIDNENYDLFNFLTEEELID